VKLVPNRHQISAIGHHLVGLSAAGISSMKASESRYSMPTIAARRSAPVNVFRAPWSFDMHDRHQVEFGRAFHEVGKVGVRQFDPPHAGR
jgi:hypothetical protein